jgi:hypothetical protein
MITFLVENEIARSNMEVMCHRSDVTNAQILAVTPHRNSGPNPGASILLVEEEQSNV